MSQSKQMAADELRKQRARDRYVRLVYLDRTTKAVQRRKSDGWGDAHLLETANGDAVECSCPDCQKSGNKCYHQQAWDMMSFDEIVFSDGDRVQL